MTTQKQIEANKQNALVSTGPVSEEGKAIVSLNAVKHGIFTRDLIITKGDGKEDEQEYRELLEGLIVSLNPQDQMQHLLVEKIAVDFWRLKRVVRFESGSIRRFLDMAISDYYNQTNLKGKKEHITNVQIDEEIAEQKGFINWNNRYIKALKKGVVSFDKPTWEGEGLERNIEEDLIMVAETIKESAMAEDEYLRFEDDELPFEELKEIFKKADYTDKEIAVELIPCLKKQNLDYQTRIHELGQKKLKNKYAEEVSVQVNSLPQVHSAEKIIKYEKAIQKSILQNLAILKRLQSLP